VHKIFPNLIQETEFRSKLGNTILTLYTVCGTRISVNIEFTLEPSGDLSRCKPSDQPLQPRLQEHIESEYFTLRRRTLFFQMDKMPNCPLSAGHTM